MFIPDKLYENNKDQKKITRLLFYFIKKSEFYCI